MIQSPNKLILISFLFLFITTAFASAAGGGLAGFVKSAALKKKNTAMRQKLSHLRFYWHDVLGGRNPTAVTVARGPATNASATAFGLVNMIDDPLTVGPSAGSGLVGRAQGLYASASLETLGLMMAMNLAFVEGKYNGSTLAVLGRNEVFSGVREMPVVGGSGLFRFARGYVQARTHAVDLKTGDAVVRYDCFVLHY